MSSAASLQEDDSTVGGTPNSDALVLFVASNSPDFLSDSLFHGLRQVLGSRVLDWPRSDMMYRDYPDELVSDSHGRGFTLYRRLEPIAIDRASIVRRLRDGAFRLVVFGSIQRQYGLWMQLRTHLPLDKSTHVAFLDGEDYPQIYPYVLEGNSRPRWRWALPRAAKRYPYFKRELMSIWAWRYAAPLPGGLARRLPVGNIRPIAFSIPEENIVDAVPEKTKAFPRHIVDAEVARRVARIETSYPFERGPTTTRIFARRGSALRPRDLVGNACVTTKSPQVARRSASAISIGNLRPVRRTASTSETPSSTAHMRNSPKS